MLVAKSPSTVRIVMAKAVADRWLQGLSRSEYRFTIFGFQNLVKARKFASMLRSLRDSGRREASEDGTHRIPKIADLGVKESGDGVVVWSADVEGLRGLSKWAEAAGLNTDFIW